MSSNRFAMIMAGGAGTRLWPLSRQNRPKQLLEFIRQPGGDRPRSLLELAAGRLDGLVPGSRQYLCTAECYRGLIRDQLPGFADSRILGEPTGRDTVNAVGFGAAVFQKINPEAVFAVLTADHLIKPDYVFREAIDRGFALVEEDPSRLVTFSITPTHPATGFGYVQRGEPIEGHEGSFKVRRFVEKPDAQRAQEYLDSGDFGWNSGMFVFSAATYMKCLERFKPESFGGLRAIQDAWGTPMQNITVERVYPKLPKISVDYAVMEPASEAKDLSICGVSMDVEWLDVGSWPSYSQTIPADAAGNRVVGRSIMSESKGNLVVSEPGHTIALLGCEDLIVVQTADATLVMPRARAEDLKLLHGQAPDDLR